MYTNPYCGIAIAFDGIDGSSKSTQAKLMVKYLQDMGVHVVYTKEPWWGMMTEGDHKLRRAITRLDNNKNAPAPDEIQKLFIDNRARHLVWEVIPLLGQASPTVVVMDRYAFSTMAYGAATTPFTFEDIYRLHEGLKYFFLPDLSFIMEVDPKEALSRIKKSPDIFEDVEVLELVRNEYLRIAAFFKNEGARLIDSSGTEDAIFKQIKPHVDKLIMEKFRH